MFRRELFRGSIINRDSRLIPVYVSCQYCIASLFLGMFLVLSGVMVTTFADNEDQKDFNDPTVTYNPNKYSTSKAIGLVILISGCIMISFAIMLFFYASLMFLKTTTTPPEDNNWQGLQEQPQQVVVSTESNGNRGDNWVETSADNENKSRD